MNSEILIALTLFKAYQPLNTKLEIQECPTKCSYRYIWRLVYTSDRSKRTLGIVAKGDTLPTKDDETLRFYVLQLVLPPSELGREFSTMYFRERRARQDEFLAQGKLGNTRVSQEESAKDRLDYAEYI